MANKIEEKKVEETITERDCIAEATSAIKFFKSLKFDEADVLYLAQEVRATCEASK